ncbi:DUF349 domain-containing protein [uncultured Duncaniella sp.]|uniref:DUF349 domain-containing protein n=1 Tax=uncultured Duncaniella sp. TaxID=2768039 RepID=UPI0025FE91E9|nr:DUF349 domain-containing protein [uncultured Duncaniella sp.]
MELNDPILKPEEVKDTTVNQEPEPAVETVAEAGAEVVEKTEPSVVMPEASVESAEAEVMADSGQTVESEAEAVPTEAGERPRHRNLSKDEILDEVRRISVLDAADISAEEISRLKQQFYTLRNEELRAEREKFLSEEGNKAEDFVAASDPVEETFKDLLGVIRDKKAAQRAAIEAEQQSNYERKKAIISKLVEMSADADNVNRVFPEVRDMQAQFKEIGEVPQQYSSEIWKSYQDAVEKFYDQLKINKELRDYDFKKNLADKEALVAEAEKLQSEEDVIVAFKKLQEFHDQWRAIGPVPKEVREEIWGKFKDLSTSINKRYQDFFVERKAKERENEDAKTAICERVEALDFSSLSTYAAWDSMTKEFMEAQADWKKLGFASRKANAELFARFRAACDKFFAAKAVFFKQMKDVLATNLERKIALCERAEALKDSTDWRATADELTRMQKEWKTIGAVAKKYSDQVWHRFLAACDYFFEQKKKNTSGTRRNERANLEQKQEIIEKLKALDANTPEREAAIKTLKDLQAEWQSVGHVPFAEKDAIYDAYRAVVNRIYSKWDNARRDSRMESFESSLSEIGGDTNRLYRERERLLRIYEQRRSELNTYENNMGFLSARSKNADSMLRDMQRRMQRLKDDLAELETKIKTIDSKL